MPSRHYLPPKTFFNQLYKHKQTYVENAQNNNKYIFIYIYNITVINYVLKIHTVPFSTIQYLVSGQNKTSLTLYWNKSY